MPRTQTDPNKEADADLLGGWKFLEHVTPRRPARTIRKDGEPAKRGRICWGITFKDPHLPPDRAPVTNSTGKKSQPEALIVAKRRNGEINDLIRAIERKEQVPKYLRLAHVQHGAKDTHRLIQKVVDDAAAAQANDGSARNIQDIGDHLVRYCTPIGIQYMHQLDGEILLGWLRTVILEPSKTHQSGEAKWYSYVDLWTRIAKTTLRSGLKYAPQLNSDILSAALPTFTKAGGQSALLKVLVNPTSEQREWIMARVWGRQPRGGDMDEGGRSLSQATLHTLLHAALRYDCRQLRALINKTDRTTEDIEACKLATVDIDQLLLQGFRRAEYSTLQRTGVLLDQKEPMDRKARTHLIKVMGKGGEERSVPLSGYTEVGIELARAQIHKRKKPDKPDAPNDYIAEHNYKELNDLFPKLLDITWMAAHKNEQGRWEETEQRGLRVLPKDLRSTGCNFAQRLHHIPPQMCANRWGHTLAVHISYYLVLTGSALEPCKTLEEAMGCAHLMRRAVRLLEIRNALGIAPRLAPRKPRNLLRKRKHAAKTPRVTAASPRPADAKSQHVG